jgi:hypothetical protein
VKSEEGRVEREGWRVKREESEELKEKIDRY